MPLLSVPPLFSVASVLNLCSKTQAPPPRYPLYLHILHLLYLLAFLLDIFYL